MKTVPLTLSFAGLQEKEEKIGEEVRAHSLLTAVLHRLSVNSHELAQGKTRVRRSENSSSKRTDKVRL